MPEFIWTKEMSEYVINNVKSVSYAFSKPIDQLRTIEYVHHNKEDTTLADLNVEEGFRMIVSSGMVGSHKNSIIK